MHSVETKRKQELLSRWSNLRSVNPVKPSIFNDVEDNKLGGEFLAMNGQSEF